jgi:transposase
VILASSVQAFVCAEPIDMRKQIDGLAQLVEPLFAADAFGGQMFVFLGKRRNKVKLLWWDRHGFFLLYKRLERGRLPRPEELARDGLSMGELMAFLEGIDLSRARRLPEVAALRVA